MSRRCDMCQVFTAKSYRRLQLNERLADVWVEFVGEVLVLPTSVILCRTCYDAVTFICDVDTKITDLNTSLTNFNKKREELSYKIACRTVKKSQTTVAHRQVLIAPDTPKKSGRKRCIFLSPVQPQKRTDEKPTPVKSKLDKREETADALTVCKIYNIKCHSWKYICFCNVVMLFDNMFRHVIIYGHIAN